MHGRICVGVGLTVLLSLGCTPQPVPAPINTGATHSVLTTILLGPSVTCEELRDGFELFHLDVVDDPAGLGMRFEEIYITVNESYNLRVWRIPSELDRGTVVISMGAVGEMACYLFSAQLFHDNGWNVVMYEYSGFGGSGGAADIGSLPDDLDAVLDWVLATDSHDRVTLYGISIGTIPAVYAAATRPEDINGIAIDSPVALGELVKAYSFALRNQTDRFVDLIDQRLISERLIQSVQTPVLFLAGAEDRLTGPASISNFFAAAPEPKTFVEFEGIGHARARFLETGRYSAELEAFMSEIWGQRVFVEDPGTGN